MFNMFAKSCFQIQIDFSLIYSEQWTVFDFTFRNFWL